MTYLYYCDVCGSPEVQVQEWRMANTNEYAGEGTADPFCVDCEDHTDIDVVETDAPYLDVDSRAREWCRAHITWKFGQ